MTKKTKVKTSKAFKEKGIGKITIIVFGAIVGVALYCAYHILPFYYYFYELQGHMEALIRIASTETDQEIRVKLLQAIKKMKIPADPEKLRIERDSGMMRISVPYSEVFYITYKGKDYDIHTFEFYAYAEGKF